MMKRNTHWALNFYKMTLHCTISPRQTHAHTHTSTHTGIAMSRWNCSCQDSRSWQLNEGSVVKLVLWDGIKTKQLSGYTNKWATGPLGVGVTGVSFGWKTAFFHMYLVSHLDHGRFILALSRWNSFYRQFSLDRQIPQWETWLYCPPPSSVKEMISRTRGCGK